MYVSPVVFLGQSCIELGLSRFMTGLPMTWLNKYKYKGLEANAFGNITDMLPMRIWRVHMGWNGCAHQSGILQETIFVQTKKRHHDVAGFLGSFRVIPLFDVSWWLYSPCWLVVNRQWMGFRMQQAQAWLVQSPILCYIRSFLCFIMHLCLLLCIAFVLWITFFWLNSGLRWF